MLKCRGVLSVKGPDAHSFLQNLLTNDMNSISPERAIYAALLTPQGKFLHEFVIFQSGEQEFLLDCESERLLDLGKRLVSYRLRSSVEISDMRDEMAVYVNPEIKQISELDEVPFKPYSADEKIFLHDLPENQRKNDQIGLAKKVKNGFACIDPRHKNLGLRAIVSLSELGDIKDLNNSEVNATNINYELTRIKACIPDGSRDIDVEKSTAAEIGLEYLKGVDFSKGCYIGQEVTNRMKNRGTSRRKLLPVEVLGKLPSPGTPISCGNREVGVIKTGLDNHAIALVRPDRILTAPEDTILAQNIPLKIDLNYRDRLEEK